MIDQTFVHDLLNRVDIVDVVGQYVQLKHAGVNHQGLCPFHQEKTPSFTVSASKQFYHCFGCGAHGSAIGFVMEHHGMSFVEAVRDLAGRVGMTVPEDKPLSREQRAQRAEQKLRSDSMAQALSVAADFYQKQLKVSARAQTYARGRGLDAAIMAQYGLGYAPTQPNLAQVFSDYQQSSALLECGLVKQNDKGRYDFFRDRLMFPIRNPKGEVIAFGGRVLEKAEPKYLNSPESALFQKGQELYGLFEGKAAISAARLAIIVEGYMDVVALAQAGVNNAVATLGTATSTAHIQKLFRFTDTIVFSFDGDAAGRKAAWRAMLNALPLATDTRTVQFLFLPPEHDPDSFVRELGKERFLGEIATAMTLSAFVLHGLQQAAPEDSIEARSRQLHFAKPILNALPVGALRTQLVHAIAKQLAITAQDVADYCELALNAKARGRAPARHKRIPPKSDVERALHLILAQPSLAGEADVALWQQQAQHGVLTDVLLALQGVEVITPAVLHHTLDSLPQHALYQSILQQQMLDAELSLEEAQEMFAILQNHLKARAMDEALAHLVVQAAHDPVARSAYTRLLAERAVLDAVVDGSATKA